MKKQNEQIKRDLLKQLGDVKDEKKAAVDGLDHKITGAKEELQKEKKHENKLESEVNNLK